MSTIGMYAALSGLTAQQAAMNAASQDIANVNTPGYTRTRANMVSVIGGGVLDTGSGVTVTSIGQLRDAFLTANANQRHRRQSRSQVASDGLGQLAGHLRRERRPAASPARWTPSGRRGTPSPTTRQPVRWRADRARQGRVARTVAEQQGRPAAATQNRARSGRARPGAVNQMLTRSPRSTTRSPCRSAPTTPTPTASSTSAASCSPSCPAWPVRPAATRPTAASRSCRAACAWSRCGVRHSEPQHNPARRDPVQAGPAVGDPQRVARSAVWQRWPVRRSRRTRPSSTRWRLAWRPRSTASWPRATRPRATSGATLPMFLSTTGPIERAPSRSTQHSAPRRPASSRCRRRPSGTGHQERAGDGRARLVADRPGRGLPLG